MKLFQNIWSPKSIVVIFLNLEGGESRYSVRLAGKRSKDYGVFEDFESLIKAVGKSRGYHIHVQGQGVLTRKVEALPNYKEQLVIGGNSNDFFFTSYDDGVNVSASFVRCSVLEELIEQFDANKWHLLGISSGEIPLCSLDENRIYHGVHHMEVSDGKVVRLERNQGEISSGYEDEIAQSIVSGYSKPNEKLEFAFREEPLTNFKEFTQFKVLGVSLLMGLLLMLTGNYFYQNYLNQAVAQLEMDLTLSNENLSLLDRLEQEKSRKEQLIANAGVTSPRFLAYYLDEIGATVPKKIDLQELYLFPLDGKLKNKKKVNIHSDRILIYGTTSDNVTLDDWIEYMDRFEWVKAIELLHYGTVTEKQSEFKLEITLMG